MRGLLFLALTVTGLIVFLQNRQPVTLFFLGTSQQSALASLTLPLGLWVVIFTVMGIVTSLIINGLSRIGQPSQRRSPTSSGNPAPQGFEPEPPPRSPSPSSTPRYQPPEPEPVVNQNEWDWDDPIPELADWDEPPAPSPPPPENPPSQESGSQRDRRRPTRPDTPAPIATPRSDRIPPEPTPAEPDVKPATPQRREPLPDLRQFEAPQTPTATKRQGTIYSQQYRPARSTAAKPSSSEQAKPPNNPVYDAPYRVINPASQPPVVNADQSEGFDDEEDWI